MAETPEQYQKRIHEARLAFEKREDAAKMRSSQILAFSSDAIKAPALVAAVGIVAALGFFSASYSQLSLDPEVFNAILFWLFASLILTVIAPGLAYFSQLAYTASIYAERWGFYSPYTADSPKSKIYRIVGDSLRGLTVAAIAISIGCLIRGGFLCFLAL